MLLQQLKNIGMLFVWVLIAVLAITSIVQDCGNSKIRTVMKHDTLRLRSDAVTIVKERIVPLYRYKTIDTPANGIHDTIMREVVRMRELQADSLQHAGLAELLTLDTTALVPVSWNNQVLKIPVLVYDTCDCISRSVRVRLWLKDTTFALEKPTMIAASTPSYSLGIGFCYGSLLDGRIMPSVGISITRTLISF